MKMKKVFWMILLTVLICMWMAVPVFALSPGVYVGSNYTTYYNPDTGQIDDGGTKNAEKGTSMSRSATGQTCLLEIDVKGHMWLTVRLLQQSKCSNVHLYTRTGNNKYTEQSYEVSASNSGNDSVDYRFRVTEVPAHLKATMYVTPIERDVVWFMACDSFKAGSGDFKVLIDENAAKAAASGETSTSQPASSAGQPSSYDDSSSSSKTSSTAKTTTSSSGSTANSSSSSSSSKTSGSTAASTTTSTAKTSETNKSSETADKDKDADMNEINEAVSEDETDDEEEEGIDRPDSGVIETVPLEKRKSNWLIPLFLIIVGLGAAGYGIWTNGGSEKWVTWRRRRK